MVRLATRLAAVNTGGNAVFGDLKPGDRFQFPGHPEISYVKGRGGWYHRLAFLTAHLGKGYRTSSGTAVVKL